MVQFFETWRDHGSCSWGSYPWLDKILAPVGRLSEAIRQTSEPTGRPKLLFYTEEKVAQARAKAEASVVIHAAVRCREA